MVDEYKTWVVHELSEWSETFNHHYPIHMDEEIKESGEAYYFIRNLIDKLNNGTCTKEDYEEILFHLWQRYYNL